MSFVFMSCGMGSLVASVNRRSPEKRSQPALSALNRRCCLGWSSSDKVEPGIGRARLGHRTLKCVLTIGTRSAQNIMASGFTAAQTGRTHDRTRPMLQQCQKVLAKAPSTHDPQRTLAAKIAVTHNAAFGRLSPRRSILNETKRHLRRSMADARSSYG